jgi:hypothetical protein
VLRSCAAPDDLPDMMFANLGTIAFFKVAYHMPVIFLQTEKSIAFGLGPM